MSIPIYKEDNDEESTVIFDNESSLDLVGLRTCGRANQRYANEQWHLKHDTCT
jgi:hypothetical protein